MKKENIKALIKSVCFLLLLTALISCATYVLRNKNEANIVRPFYDEPDDSLDVLFIGSSHFMCGIYPMELWNDYGIASYVFASSAQVLPQSYYQVQEALRTQTPKLIVLDCSGAVYDGLLGTPEYVHVQFDNMSLSPIKFKAINDLITNKDDRLEYYFNLYKFHTRWKELSGSDFEKIASVTKGSSISANVSAECTDIVPVPKEMTEELYDNVENYLIKIIKLCKERNIELLLVNVPLIETESNQKMFNYIYKIADEYELTYLNMLHNLDELNFDFKTDMRDLNHCNVYGGKKVTKYIGEYLSKNYDIPDRRTDPDYDYWNTQYKEYKSIYNY